MLIMTETGLFCPAGNFYIDPKRGVAHAIITHAHSDHARSGSQQYYCTTSGVPLLRERLGQKIQIMDFPYQQTFSLNGVTVSFHPAGHILGSSQIRMEYAGEVWVVSGDYKRDADATCAPFEPVQCHVFVSEATFGTPSFTWDKNIDRGEEIYQWWNSNMKQNMNSIIFAYSLGKAQRVLNLLAPYAKKPIYCNLPTNKINACYRQQNIVLAETKCLSATDEHTIFNGELIIIPPQSLELMPARWLGNNYKTAFASGWTARKNNRFDRGFLISDHADWNDLIHTILETKAQRIYVQHRGNGALVREIRSRGLKAFPDAALTPKNPAQLQLF